MSVQIRLVPRSIRGHNEGRILFGTVRGSNPPHSQKLF